jgi:deoxyribose-phosphate aldolase
MSNLTPLALVRRIEYALLDPQLARDDIEQGCASAVMRDAYSVIVKPHYVELVHKLVKDAGIKTASIVGFPHGGSSTATKMYETQDIVQRGAEEITMVLNIGALRDNDDLHVHNDIGIVVRTARGRPVTVILEMGLLTEQEVARACKIADSAGANYVQTYTGFDAGRISLDHVRFLRTVSGHLQIKAHNPSHSFKTALEMIEAGAARVVIPHT